MRFTLGDAFVDGYALALPIDVELFFMQCIILSSSFIVYPFCVPLLCPPRGGSASG